MPEPEVNVEAEPGVAEAERRNRGRSEPVRARDETQFEGVREKRAKFDKASSRPVSGADANEDDGIQSKRTRGNYTRGKEFYVTKKDVQMFWQTVGCPACANSTKGISGRLAHNNECCDRIGNLLMDEGAQRIKSYLERARVREETGYRRSSNEFRIRDRHDGFTGGGKKDGKHEKKRKMEKEEKEKKVKKERKKKQN